MMIPGGSGPTGQFKPETLYFAFGSNLQLAQMAMRCPQSRYLGIGRLQGYRWQINQRGYANVIPSPHDYVDGLCFLLDANDEMNLDRAEGVAGGAYDKMLLDLALVIAKANLVGRKVSEIMRTGFAHSNVHGGQEAVKDQFSGGNGGQIEINRSMNPLQSSGGTNMALAEHDRDSETHQESEQTLQGISSATFEGEMTQVLVYASQRYTKEGKPWDEYVKRMNLGIRDALKLGVSEEYVDTYIRKYIPA